MVLPNNIFAGFCSNQLEYPSLITEKSGNVPFYINGYVQDDGNWLPPVANRFALKKNEKEDKKKHVKHIDIKRMARDLEATRALDSSYLNRILLDDCVALCWKVWKLSNKTSVKQHF